MERFLVVKPVLRKDVPVGKNGHAKRAYCDATLFDGKDKVALIEFDENCHDSYPAECELSRYHTLHHGLETERKHTRVFRIHTSFSLEDPTSLEDKVRVLAENIRGGVHLLQPRCKTNIH